MKLSNYPRPAGDNGRGIHWSPSTIHPEGEGLDPWLGELLRMSIKWVKLLDDGDGSSLELCRQLVQNNIMPIVRLYRAHPNPYRLGYRQEETIRQLVDVGVHYFETNNEPDLPAEWKDERLPPDWLRVVVEQFIHDAHRILELGGLPGLPAMSVGSQANPISLIVREGRSDLFARGAWIAVHNYTLNHPLDYPYDDVNQSGAQLTRKQYETLGSWAWDEQPRQLINIWRRQGKRPDQSIEETSDCWRCFELADLMAREALGHSVPVIGTEGGAAIGWRDDRRYPRITPGLHKEYTLQINQYMQTEAPNYLFTTCHWLLANSRLGHQQMGWESQAWFSNWWEADFGIIDHLPAVDAVREMPSIVRTMTLAESELRGVALDRAGQGVYGVPITLSADGQVIATARTNARGRFNFTELPGGEYELRAEKWLDDDIGVSLSAGGIETVDMRLDHGYQSAIRGITVSVDGESLPGIEVNLRGEGLQQAAISDKSGAFSFSELREGTYELTAGAAQINGIYLDGWSGRERNILVPPAPVPRFIVANRRLLDREETAGRHLFFGQVWDESGAPLDGVTLEMSWNEAAPGTQFPTAITGSDPHKSGGYYEFVNTPGRFQIRVADDEIESELAGDLVTIDVPGRRGESISYEVNFQRILEPLVAESSRIEIALPGCAETTTVELRREGKKNRLPAARTESDEFVFETLGPGSYEVLVSDLGSVGIVEVDGLNPGFLRLPMSSAITVEINPGAAKGRLKLNEEGWGIEREQQVTPGSSVQFANLPAGTYHLRYLGWRSDPIQLDGVQAIVIHNVDIQLPHESCLEGRVLNADGEALAGQEIVLTAGEEIRGDQFTDSRGRYQFAGLPKGMYTLVIEELGIVKPGIEIDGFESRRVDLVAPVEVRPKLIEHYLLLARQSSPGPWVTLLLLHDYIRRFGPVIGFAPKEATLAQQVTIVAEPATIGEDVEQMLLEAGCMVQRLPGESHELSAALRRVLK